MRFETVSSGLRISWAMVADRRPADVRRSLERKVCSVWRRCVISRKTSTIPASWLRSFRIGDPVSSIGYSCSGTAYECNVAGNVHHPLRAANQCHRILKFGTGPFVDDAQDFTQWPSAGCLVVPAGEFFGDRVDERHVPRSVGGDDGIAQAGEGDAIRLTAFL